MKRRGIGVLGIAVASWAAACSGSSTGTNGGNNNTGPTIPPAYFASGIAYDGSRGKVVIFGGSGMNQFQSPDTWEWDGASWSRLAGSGPPGRTWSSLVFDAARARSVLFSGTTFSAIVSDTWEYDGTWRQVTGATPPGRYAHEISYDTQRQSVLLFGGRNESVVFNDLWELKNGAWQLLNPTGAPAGRAAHGQAYDVARDRLVVFGGFGPPFSTTPTIFGDTWEWDGTGWQQKATTGPAPRDHVSMAYDAARQRTVLFGGHTGSTTTLTDTWEWDGAGWQQRATIGPTVDGGHRLTYDTRRQHVALWTGTNGSTPATVIWEWNGQIWEHIP